MLKSDKSFSFLFKSISTFCSLNILALIEAGLWNTEGTSVRVDIFFNSSKSESKYSIGG